MADRDALDEEDAIRDFFRKGLNYDEMLAFLNRYNGIEMSVVTIKRRIKEYGLKSAVARVEKSISFIFCS